MRPSTNPAPTRTSASTSPMRAARASVPRWVCRSSMKRSSRWRKSSQALQKVFFYLEQEVMKPRYEIHSLSMNNAVQPSGGGEDDLAARALFSATELAAPAKLDAVFGHDLPEAQHAAYVERYQAALHDQVQKLAAQMTSAYVATSASRVKEFNRMLAATRDAWGTPLRVQPQNWRGKQNYYLVSSAGPDHRFDTGDELSVYVEEHTGNIVRHPGANGRADFAIEHDRGPANGRAEFTGVINDPSGATIPGATVTLRLAGEPAARTTHTDRTGSFTLTGLTPGRYTAQLAMPGFESLTQTFTVAPRDRATLTAVLMLGSVSETVDVSDATAIANRHHAVRSDAPAHDAGRCSGARKSPACRPRHGGHGDGRDISQWARARKERVLHTARAHQLRRRRARHARALVLPGSALHQPGNHHRRARQRQHHHPRCRLHHNVAHGHARVDKRRSHRHGYKLAESVSGLLRRSRPPRHTHAGRPRQHSAGHLQLHRQARGRCPLAATGCVVLACRRHRQQVCRGRLRASGRGAFQHQREPHRQVQTHTHRAHAGLGQAGITRRHHRPRD